MDVNTDIYGTLEGFLMFYRCLSKIGRASNRGRRKLLLSASVKMKWLLLALFSSRVEKSICPVGKTLIKLLQKSKR